MVQPPASIDSAPRVQRDLATEGANLIPSVASIRCRVVDVLDRALTSDAPLPR